MYFIVYIHIIKEGVHIKNFVGFPSSGCGLIKEVGFS